MRYISNQLSIAFFITLFNQGCSLLEATDKTLGAVQSGLEEISKKQKMLYLPPEQRKAMQEQEEIKTHQ